MVLLFEEGETWPEFPLGDIECAVLVLRGLDIRGKVENAQPGGTPASRDKRVSFFFALSGAEGGALMVWTKTVWMYVHKAWQEDM